jgi:2-polyprenyl-6-methoxyphenol hydroxylase-like FAD-dependent oxidoreductase
LCGAQVAVYERSAGQMQARGAGVVMQPDVPWLLRAHGSDPDALCVPLRQRQYLLDDGRVARQHMPQMMTAWDVLYRALRAPLAEVCYRQDSQLVEFSRDDRAVEVRFADGHRAEADFLVGADGITSACRAALLGTHSGPQYAGYVAWRGLEDENGLPEDLVGQLAERFTLFVADGMQLLCYLVPGADGDTAPGGRRVNWVWYVNTPADDLTGLLHGRSGRDYVAFLPPGELQATAQARLLTLADRTLPPLLGRLVACSQVFMQPVQDLPSARMAFQRAALIGDAAGTVRPHTASGTSKAFADATLLAMALDGWRTPDPPPSTRLAQWERQRLSDLVAIADMGLRSAAGSQLGVEGAAAPWAEATT